MGKSLNRRMYPFLRPKKVESSMYILRAQFLLRLLCGHDPPHTERIQRSSQVWFYAVALRCVGAYIKGPRRYGIFPFCCSRCQRINSS